MDELELLLRKNKLDILIIRAMHECDKGKVPKGKLEALETLKDTLELILELSQEIRDLTKMLRKLKLDNAISYRYNAKLKVKINKLEEISLTTINNEDKILLNNALSKGYFDLNKQKLAFMCLKECNLLKKNESKFSMVDQKKKFEDIKKFFLNIDNEKIKLNSEIKIKPIFIVGMPRSGTSLLEQILSSHTEIYGAGELNFLQKIVDNLGLKKPSNMSEYFQKIREYYYDKIYKISQNHFIIDKLPLNFRWIGFIVKSFPEAKIIHIRRNPMAVCWSNYKTLFVDEGMDFTLSQKDIADYYGMYFDLMKFWKKEFNHNIIEISYEDYVKDFEGNTKKILKYLDLNWEVQMKNYAKTSRSVTTASYQQVRENIKKNTSEIWKKYRVHLKEMENTLENLKIKF